MKNAKSRFAGARRPRRSGAAHTEGDRGSGPGEWLFGIHAVLAAAANPRRKIRTVLATASGAIHLPPQLMVKPKIVAPQELEASLPKDAVHQGLALLADPLPGVGIEEVCGTGEDGLVLALDQVTDPHNVGAILRSASAFGARALIMTERHAPSAMGTLAKSASGALEHVPIIRIVNLARALDELKELGYEVMGLDEAAPQRLDEIAPGARTALVLGAEGTGLRRLTRERCDRLLRLPTQGPIASLNVSNAAAVALYTLAAARRPLNQKS